WTLVLEAVRRPLDDLKQQSMILREAAGVPRDNDVIAGSERRRGQASFGELLRRSTFDDPDLLLSLFIGSFDLHERVRVAPDELLQRAVDPDDLAVNVCGRRRVVREGRTIGRYENDPG